MFLSFSVSSVSAANTSSNYECLECDILEGKVAVDYINKAFESKVYQNKVSHKEIKNAQTTYFKAGENFPEDVVVVSGMIGEDETNSVQVFITANDKKVVKVSHIQSTGLNSDDDFTLKAYDSKGNLRATSEGTIKENTLFCLWLNCTL
ncbi:hypothetical protein CEW92_08520 [Bacillaceae bacterium SAS-127]|nr:hypothetical protein CEW92_08520 [Bacillaceae bacterium SAS-127]